MRNRFASLLLLTSALTACSMAPDFKTPDLSLPGSFKEQPVEAASSAEAGSWKKAEALEKDDRGHWWKIFGDDKLNELETQAQESNQDLKAAASRVDEARDLARVNTDSYFPDIDIGANPLRTQPASATLAAFGQPPVGLKPYNMYSAGGSATYEADLFGKVRDNYRAYKYDADAQAAAYRSVLLALQADVAQNYYSIRSLDAERALMRDTVKLRIEAQRIMERRFKAGDVGEQDYTRTKSELASTNAELLSLDRSRAKYEHALAVLTGKLPSEFTLAEAPFEGPPPAVPAGLPSSLLERRPDISQAMLSMEAANARIGVARTAFFPSVILTASGGFESISLSDLFKWSSRTWALGQLAGSAITMPIFDSGRNMANLDEAHAAYEESLAHYRQGVLVAFRDVEDNLVDQRLLADQLARANEAAQAAQRTTDLTQKRYEGGDVDFFEVIDAQRDSLAAARAAVQTRGARFITTVTLIRALGGGFEEAPQNAAPIAAPAPAPEAPAGANVPSPKEPVITAPPAEKAAPAAEQATAPATVPDATPQPLAEKSQPVEVPPAADQKAPEPVATPAAETTAPDAAPAAAEPQPLIVPKDATQPLPH